VPYACIHRKRSVRHTLALLGYFTSEIGYTQAMRYVESPGRYDPCATYAPGEKAFPPWATIPSWQDLAGGRRWHFFFAWVLVFNSALYLLVSFVNGHVRRDLVPTRAEISARHLARELWNHLRLRFSFGQAARHYNTLQKLAYLGVIFVLAPMMLVTGLTMSPGMDAAAPWLLELLGGRQSARTLHFLTAMLIVLFIVVHLVMVLLAGPLNELRSMITGRFTVPPDSSE